ncbi:MAG: hypothetical protein KDC78_03935 [Aequorivita sp.]|nr:hypothetical protein [Aequorivita sp.]
MKYFFFIAFFICFLGHSQDLAELRSQYPKADENAEITKKLNGELSNVVQTDNPILVAYKGAILTLMAKEAKKIKDKMSFFKEGVSFLESAVKADPLNIEIRTIRLSVQESAPRFMGYDKSEDEDKKFILDNYIKSSSKVIREFVRNFVLNSDSFDKSEKETF